MLTNFSPIVKYNNPVYIQVLMWIGYAISGIFVVGFTSDIQDQRQEQLLEQASLVADQLQSNSLDLRKQTERLQRRTDFLVNLIKVLKDLGNPRQVSDMVKLIVNSIQEEFGFSYVAFYKISGLLSPAELWETAGKYSTDWKVLNDHIMLDAQDPIAEVARLGHPMISRNGHASRSTIDDAKARATIPVGNSQSAVHGVLDLQDKDAEVFSELGLLLLQMLGEQLSLVLESTDRYETIHHRLEEISRLSRENNLASWHQWIHPRTNLTYRYRKDPSAESDPSQNKGDDEPVLDQGELTLPLSTLQGDVLGYVTAHKSSMWGVDEITLLEMLIAQVEQTLENARLFEATEKRAIREQMTRRISDNIRSALTVEDAIRRAVTELAVVVDAAEVSAQLKVMDVESTDQGDHDA
jgi:GAF domain-containing protein